MKRNILLFMFLGLLVSASAQNAQNSQCNTYLGDYKIYDIADAGDYLWLTDGKGAIKFNKQAQTALYYTIDNLEISPDDYHWSIITSIVCDDNGLPYVGARFTGLLKMNENEEWILLPPANAEQLKNWGSVIPLITENNEVWATVTGLFAFPMMLVKYQGNTVETFMTDSPILSLAEDKDGNLWTGRMGGGLFLGQDHYESLVKYDGEKWTTFNSPLELGPPPFGIREINFDDSGNIWMVGHFGLLDNGESKLIKFNDPEWQVYDLPVKARLISLALENDSVIWLGTDKGLMRFSNFQWTVFNTENSKLPSNNINCVVVDNNGTKWLGTYEGLVAFNGTATDEGVAAFNGVSSGEGHVGFDGTGSDEGHIGSDGTGPDEGLVGFDGNGLPLSISDDFEMMNEIELFPNPAKDFITLKIPGELQEITVNLLNIQGCVMESIKVDNNQYRLDVTHLPAGVYLLRIKCQQNHILKKFVKQ